MKKLLKATLATVCMAGLVASSSAIQITYATRGVGEWTPSNEFNSDASVLAGVKRTVNIWNGDASAGLYTLGGDSATFTEGAGTLVPAVLVLPTAYINRFEGNFGSWAGIDNTSGAIQYLTAKYANDTQQVFFIGNLLESGITVPTANGLSHVAWLNGTPSRVPDAGATLILLGSSMMVLGFLRRKISA